MPNHMGGRAVPRSFCVRTGTHSQLPIFDSDGLASSGVCTVVPRRSFKVRGSVMLRLYSLLALVLGFGVIGCDESAGPNGFGNPFASWGQSPVPTYGQFYITSTWTRQSNNQSYRSGGEIYDGTGSSAHYVSGGLMTASGLQIGEERPGKYLSFRAPQFGTTAVWGLSGNPSAGIPGFVDSMYMPAEIRILAPVLKSISRSAPLSVQWNADPNNDSVLVSVNDISEPPEPYTNLQYSWAAVVPDNGSYTIPSSVFLNMPAGSLVKVSLVRGAGKTTGTLSHPFHIYGTTTALDAYKLTP